MEGREAGTAGGLRATRYLAREARRLGLVPAGDSGSYFQTVPVIRRRVAPRSTLRVAGRELRLGTDWSAAAVPAAPLHRDRIGVVYGGTLTFSTGPLRPEVTMGKLVIFEPRRRVNQRLLDRADSLAPGAAAIALMGPAPLRNLLPDSAELLDDPSSAGPGTTPLLWLSDQAGAALFRRPMPLIWSGSGGRTVALDLSFDDSAPPYPVRNVVAILPGRDPAMRGQYVAVGAHWDHLGRADRPVDHDSLRLFGHFVRPGGAEDRGRPEAPEAERLAGRQLAAWRAAHPGESRPDSIYNGADDDGSGSVALLELAERLRGRGDAPRRSVLLVWHAAEEEGLWGSTYFTDHPTVPRDSVVAQVNLDMIGRGDAWDLTGRSATGTPRYGGQGYLQVVGAGRRSAELGALVESVNRTGEHGLVFDSTPDRAGDPAQVYCRSDHWSYARYGIPVVFFSTGGHSDYHEVTDEARYVDYHRLEQVTRFVTDLVRHLADLDHRLVRDGQRPEPRAACEQ